MCKFLHHGIFIWWIVGVILHSDWLKKTLKVSKLFLSGTVCWNTLLGKTEPYSNDWHSSKWHFMRGFMFLYHIFDGTDEFSLSDLKHLALKLKFSMIIRSMCVRKDFSCMSHIKADTEIVEHGDIFLCCLEMNSAWQGLREENYHQISNITCTKSLTLNVSSLILQLLLPKPGIKWRRKM